MKSMQRPMKKIIAMTLAITGGPVKLLKIKRSCVLPHSLSPLISLMNWIDAPIKRRENIAINK